MTAIPLKAWAMDKGVHIQTARRYVQEGRLPVLRRSRCYFVPADAPKPTSRRRRDR